MDNYITRLHELNHMIWRLIIFWFYVFFLILVFLFVKFCEIALAILYHLVKSAKAELVYN